MRIITASLFALALALPSAAQAQSKDISKDRQDIRQDRGELRKDQQDISKDRKDIRQSASGSSARDQWRARPVTL